jgi:hypothetical protein
MDTVNTSMMDLLTESDLASVFRVEVNTLRVWRREETGPPYVKIGRSTFYRKDDVANWLSYSVQLPTGTKMWHPYVNPPKDDCYLSDLKLG